MNIFQEIRKGCITLNWIIERGGFSFKMGGATITLKHVPVWTGKAILFFFQLYKITISILPWKSYFKKKKKGKNRKNREYSDVIQFLRWGKSITLTIGGRVHVASESSKHSLIFFFFVARVLKSKDIQTIDEQYHLEITMGMVGWVKWDAGEWKRVRHFVLLKMQNKNVPTFVFFSFKWKSMISFTSQDWAIQSISSFLPSF